MVDVVKNRKAVESARRRLRQHCCAAKIVETPDYVQVWYPAGITNRGRHGVRVSFALGKARAYRHALDYCETAWQESLLWWRK